MSSISQYRVKEPIAAFSIIGLTDTRIPIGAIVEYSPSVYLIRGKLVEIYWRGGLYRVLLSDLLQRAEFIGSR